MNEEDRDLFSVLGLGAGAIKAEVRRAYRKMAIKWHPDKNPGSSVAEERFKEIHAAYERLIEIAPEVRPRDPRQVDVPINRVEPPPAPKPRKTRMVEVLEDLEGSIVDDVLPKSN